MCSEPHDVVVIVTLHLQLPGVVYDLNVIQIQTARITPTNSVYFRKARPDSVSMRVHLPQLWNLPGQIIEVELGRCQKTIC